MDKLKFRVWDGNHNKFIYPDVVELNCGIDYQQYTGIEDEAGTEIYEGDIVEYKYYYAHRRWWSNTGEIEEIKKEFQKQKDNYDVRKGVVKFRDGKFTISHGIDFSDVSRGQKVDRGKTTSGEYETKAWDFKVIGNIHVNPELLNE